MSFIPYNPLDDLEREQKERIDIASKIMQEQFESQEPIEYEDTMFKDMANDLISSKHKIEKRLDTMISDSAKSEKKSNLIAILTLICTALGLIIAIIGIIIQFL